MERNARTTITEENMEREKKKLISTIKKATTTENYIKLELREEKNVAN